MKMKTKSDIESTVELFTQNYFFLDALITDFISIYMIESDCSKNGKKRHEFIELFLDNESSKRKTDILLKIINKKFPQHKKIIKEKDFDFIRKMRNKIAHSVLNYEINPNDYSSSKIKLHGFDKGEMVSSQYDYNEIMKAISSCIMISIALDAEKKQMCESRWSQEAIFRTMMKEKKNKQ
jgi:hypothetical protein